MSRTKYLYKTLLRWLGSGSRSGSLGYVSPWNAVRAEQEAKATERMLLGACGPVRMEDAASRRRAQFWRDVEAKQARGRVLPLRRSR